MRSVHICVVGAGTEVGKTCVGAGLLAAFRRRGLASLGLKPIESGVAEGFAADAFKLGEAAGRVIPPLYALAAPLSPHLAGRLEGVRIELAAVAHWISERRREHAAADGNEQLSRRTGTAGEGLQSLRVTLSETAGGLLTPLTDEGLTNLDLCRAIEPTVVLAVVRNELGALHHSGALMLALDTAGLFDRTILVLHGGSDGSAERSNAAELQRLGVAPEVVTIPLEAEGRDFDDLVEALLERFT